MAGLLLSDDALRRQRVQRRCTRPIRPGSHHSNITSSLLPQQLPPHTRVSRLVTRPLRIQTPSMASTASSEVWKWPYWMFEQMIKRLNKKNEEENKRSENERKEQSKMFNTSGIDGAMSRAKSMIPRPR